MNRKKSKKINVQKNKINKYMQAAYLQLLEENSESSHGRANTPTSTATPSLIPPPTPTLSLSPVTDWKDEFELLEKKYDEVNAENQKLMSDNQGLKKLLRKSQHLNMFKDLQLQKQLSIGASKPTRMLFHEYETQFSKEHLKELRSVRKGKEKDATFLTKLVGFLYPNGVEQKCVKKRKDTVKKGKIPISPDKYELLENMFVERIRSECVTDEVTLERCGRFNKVLGYSLITVQRKPTNQILLGKLIANDKHTNLDSQATTPGRMTPLQAPLEANSIPKYAGYQFVSPALSYPTPTYSTPIAMQAMAPNQIEYTPFDSKFLSRFSGHQNVPHQTAPLCPIQKILSPQIAPTNQVYHEMLTTKTSEFGVNSATHAKINKIHHN